MAQRPNRDREEFQKKTGLSKSQANRRAAEGTATESFEAAKERKEKATADLRERQAERAQIELDAAKGKLVSKDEVREQGRKLGALLSALLGSCRANWPSRFAGLNESQVREKLDVELDKFTEELRAEIRKICS